MMKLALIKQILHKLMVLLTGITFLAGTGALPIVPSSMLFVKAYCYHDSEANWEMQANSAATSSIATAIGVNTVYHDIDGDGMVCNAIFVDANNNLVVVQITHSQYAQMGQRGGGQFNPTKTQFTSVFQALATPVQAAIAFDTFLNDDTTGTTATIALTMSSTANGYIACGWGQGNNVDNLTNLAYNGVNLTQFQLVSPDAFSASHQYLLGLANPSTGANNMVWNRAASGEARTNCQSYTGVNQNTTPDNSGKLALPTTGAFTATTTLADNTVWAIAFCGWQRGPTISGFTQRSNTGNAYKGGDTNGTFNTSVNLTCSFTGSNNDNSVTWLTLTTPSATVANPSQDLIIIQDE